MENEKILHSWIMWPVELCSIANLFCWSLKRLSFSPCYDRTVIQSQRHFILLIFVLFCFCIEKLSRLKIWNCSLYIENEDLRLGPMLV